MIYTDTVKGVSTLNSKKVFSDNFKNLIKSRGLSRPKVSDALDVPYSTIVNWTTEQAYPSIKNMNKICKYFNVSQSQLVEPKNSVPNNVIKPKGYVKLPVIGSIPCGDPNTAIRETNDYKLVPSDEDTQGMFFLRADGASMEPKIEDKSLVKIHKQNTIENGEIAAVSINGEDATLKKVIMDERGKIVMFHPLNPSFKDIFPSPGNRYKLIGKAVSVLNPL